MSSRDGLLTIGTATYTKREENMLLKMLRKNPEYWKNDRDIEATVGNPVHYCKTYEYGRCLCGYNEKI